METGIQESADGNIVCILIGCAGVLSRHKTKNRLDLWGNVLLNVNVKMDCVAVRYARGI